MTVSVPDVPSPNATGAKVGAIPGVDQFEICIWRRNNFLTEVCIRAWMLRT